MRVELEIKKWRGWRATASQVMSITKSLPYFRTASGTYIHRIRSGNVYFWNTRPEHTAFRLWCGMVGHTGGTKRGLRVDGEVLAEVPLGSPLCATCEGRAIGAGQTDSRMICGRIVKYSPRT